MVSVRERLRAVQRKGKDMAKAGKETSVTLEALVNGEVSEEQVSSLSFEQALKLLEEVVTSVESGTLPLDRAIGDHQRSGLRSLTKAGAAVEIKRPTAHEYGIGGERNAAAKRQRQSAECSTAERSHTAYPPLLSFLIFAQ